MTGSTGLRRSCTAPTHQSSIGSPPRSCVPMCSGASPGKVAANRIDMLLPCTWKAQPRSRRIQATSSMTDRRQSTHPTSKLGDIAFDALMRARAIASHMDDERPGWISLSPDHRTEVHRSTAGDPGAHRCDALDMPMETAAHEPHRPSWRNIIGSRRLWRKRLRHISPASASTVPKPVTAWIGVSRS